jgi:hypothetical protein
LVQDLLTHCIILYELCSNCTVLTPVFSHFLVFLLSRYCRVLYHRGTMEHSGFHTLIYGPVFEFFGKKWSLSKNKIVFDVFEAFLRHFVFSTIIDNFSSFFRRYVQPRKYFRKVENLSICRPVDLILAKKPQYCSPCFPIQPPSTGLRNLKLQKNSSKSSPEHHVYAPLCAHC